MCALYTRNFKIKIGLKITSIKSIKIIPISMPVKDLGAITY